MYILLLVEGGHWGKPDCDICSQFSNWVDQLTTRDYINQEVFSEKLQRIWWWPVVLHQKQGESSRHYNITGMTKANHQSILWWTNTQCISSVYLSCFRGVSVLDKGSLSLWGFDSHPMEVERALNLVKYCCVHVLCSTPRPTHCRGRNYLLAMWDYDTWCFTLQHYLIVCCWFPVLVCHCVIQKHDQYPAVFIAARRLLCPQHPSLYSYTRLSATPHPWWCCGHKHHTLYCSSHQWSIKWQSKGTSVS